jgi:hypothetical protein
MYNFLFVLYILSLSYIIYKHFSIVRYPNSRTVRDKKFFLSLCFVSCLIIFVFLYFLIYYFFPIEGIVSDSGIFLIQIILGMEPTLNYGIRVFYFCVFVYTFFLIYYFMTINILSKQYSSIFKFYYSNIVLVIYLSLLYSIVFLFIPAFFNSTNLYLADNNIKFINISKDDIVFDFIKNIYGSVAVLVWIFIPIAYMKGYEEYKEDVLKGDKND